MPAMTRLVTVLAALLLVLVACGGASPSTSPSPIPTASPAAASATPGPSASPTPGSTSDGAAIFAMIEDQVIAERGLEAKQRPVPIIISADEARAWLESHYREQQTAEEIATAEETLKALGLLPADASLDDLYLDILGSQYAAFYEPDTDQLFVISRSAGIGPAEKVYFSHEFTHALQDQHFGVEEIDDPAGGQGDRSLARLTLVEGDASLLMARWMSEHLDPADLGELLKVDPEAQAQLERMPAILRETLLFPYQQGLIFVNGIWARGGWEAVDGAYARLPDSTEQVLHPEKYEAREMPVEVRSRRGRARERDGRRLVGHARGHARRVPALGLAARERGEGAAGQRRRRRLGRRPPRLPARPRWRVRAGPADRLGHGRRRRRVRRCGRDGGRRRRLAGHGRPLVGVRGRRGPGERWRGAERGSRRSGAQPPRLNDPYIDSGAEIPRRPSAPARVSCAARTSARRERERSGSAGSTTRASR